MKDGRNDFHPWNKNAVPIPMAPAYGGYGVTHSATAQPSLTRPDKAAARSPVVEPMVVEQADNSAGFARNSRKASRYYGGGGCSARLSRISQIGRAF